MADGAVDIVLPTGEAATVPQADLARALAAGAKAAPTGPQYAPGSEGEFWNSGLGQALTGLYGAGRSATAGLSDVIVAEGANIVGGESARKEALHTFSAAKAANPYADLAGEVGGLFIGGGGITQAGEMAEAGIAARAGEGLLGKVLAGGGRGLVEGGLLGAEHSLTEDTLGDHALNGEKMFATMGKEGLLGLGAGAAIGAAGYGLGKVFGSGAATAERTALEEGVEGGGRATKNAVDDVVGLEGSGRGVQESMRASEETIEALRKTAMPGEEAAKLVDGMSKLTDSLSAEQKKIPGVIDQARDMYLKAAGVTGERAEIMKRGYEIQTGLREAHEDVLRAKSSSLAKKATSVFQDLEDTANEIQFAEKPQMMRKLIDPSFTEAARDASANMFQRVEDVVAEMKGLSSKGGSEGAINRIAKEMADLRRVFAKEGAEAGDYFIAADKLKRAVGKYANHSVKYGKTEAQNALTEVYEGLRGALEDEASFGLGGRAQKELNESFSTMFERRNHVAQTIGQTFDRGELGVKLTGGDFEKVQSMMRSLTGDATDAEIESVKSVEKFIDGMRKRVGAVEQYGDLNPAQLAKMQRGKQALEEFAEEFSAARKEISANNKLREIQIAERDAPRLGGLVGMIGDVATKPLTTLQRLAEIRSATTRMTDTIEKGFKKAVEFRAGATKVTAGARDAAEKEIGHIRELGGNPAALAERAREMTAPLSKVAPKIAEEVAATAMRAVTFLAKEAPIPLGSRAIMGMPTKQARYSDAQIASWQTKRAAALGAADGTTSPEFILGDLQRGRLNRDAIRTIEFVSPKLFAEMQQTAQRQISQMAAEGKLDTLTIAQQGAIASLLKVPPGKMWEPDFMLMMQSAKSLPQYAEQNRAAGASAQPGGMAKRAIKLDTGVFQTETQAIEAR